MPKSMSRGMRLARIVAMAVIIGIGLIAAIPAAKFTRAKNLFDRAEEKFEVAVAIYQRIGAGQPWVKRVQRLRGGWKECKRRGRNKGDPGNGRNFCAN